ncbi:FAD-dependent oxidoreductase [Litoreibacter roseus]|uniref:Glutathione-disulfide reductase n=1 Tax=Litoreibacter roseus TaxID=2601869 RepID=A0A6N6JKG7_9RHOB|nr:FAD-dependent oxidoreductase [Litoreibacter roseus]GFE65929.1 glutathione-disulfide reductase [Litoreibacter roseus]
MSFDYDLFVIGGGSGGVRAARVAAATGAKVALAEERRLGGTCVIRGCVPKKLMVFASEYRDRMQEAKDYGWSVEVGDFEWGGFHSHLRSELERLEGVYRDLLKSSDVEIFDTRATLKDPHTISLKDGKDVTAKHILIATGGHPVKPDMPNANLGIVSDDIFHLKELPKRLLIIGGGYIACEFACIMHGLGVDVTLYYRGAQILRGFDDEARGLISDMMGKRGINIHLGTNIVEMRLAGDVDDTSHTVTASDASMGPSNLQQQEMRTNDDGGTDGPIWIKSSNGREAVFDQVLFATGRTPNTQDLGLENTEIEVGRRSEIIVDEYSQTAQPSVYAIGDVTNRVNLTPVAIREGMAFVETVFKGNPTPVDHDLIPSAVFTQPELGTIGMTEEDAREQEPVDIYCTSFRPMQGAFIGREDRVLMKLIVSKETDKVLGCHIVAPGAGEMIQLAGVAVKMGATKAQFDQVCAVHPTMSEEMVTMKTPMRSA